MADDKGSCKNALICPFHGWVYNLDGTLRGAARPQSFPEMDKNEFGLLAARTGNLDGIYLHPIPERDRSHPWRRSSALSKKRSRITASRTWYPPTQVWSEISEVNWKSVRDVDNEGYHVAMAHPALQDLYGSTYYDEPFVNGICRSYASYNPHAGRRWSVRNYINIAPEPEHLPEPLKNAWVYYGLFPNAVISVTPEGAQFYQEFPLSTGKSLLRGRAYCYRDESRPQRLARYLAQRIDRETMEEDIQLTKWSNEAMESKAFQGFYLSDLEYGVRTHHDHLRGVLPVLNMKEAPDEKGMEEINERLLEEASR